MKCFHKLALGLATATLFGLAGTVRGEEPATIPQPVTFAMGSDIHKDIMHDADQRLQAFVEAASQAKADFIIQLGDFCQPKPANLGFLKIWNSFPGERHHVLGNHDMDGGFKREQTIAYLGMPAKYYSFDVKGWHFVVLDGNDPDIPKKPGYASRIGPEQLAWLKEDLKKTQSPTVVFSHQGADGALRNAAEVRAVLEEANREAGRTKVVAAFCGHNHIDLDTPINGIHYLQVNSMSDFWLGDKFACVRYGKEVDAKFPHLKYTAPYRDPLFAIVTLEPKKITIRGIESTWVGPSPKELKHPESLANGPEKNGIAPRISSRALEL